MNNEHKDNTIAGPDGKLYSYDINNPIIIDIREINIEIKAILLYEFENNDANACGKVNIEIIKTIPILFIFTIIDIETNIIIK